MGAVTLYKTLVDCVVWLWETIVQWALWLWVTVTTWVKKFVRIVIK